MPESYQFGLRYRLLDQREELAFLTADVLLEFGAEEVQAPRLRDLAGKLHRQRSDPHMIYQYQTDYWLVCRGEPRKCREQDLLLLTKMRQSLGSPEVEESVPSFFRVRAHRSTQALSDHERNVVIARELLDGWVALHRRVSEPERCQ